MFNRKSFSSKRTTDTESQKKLAEQMLEILLELPEGKWNLRESVVDKLEELGELPHRREIDAAWEIVKKKAFKSHSRKFTLDLRKELIWIDDPVQQAQVGPRQENLRQAHPEAQRAGACRGMHRRLDGREADPGLQGVNAATTPRGGGADGG